MSLDKMFKKAHARHMKHDYPGAEKLYKQILSLRPDHIDANYLLGTMYAERGLLAEAEKYLQYAQKMAPTSPYIQINLGNVYKINNKYEDAKRCFEMAIRLKPDLSQAYFGLGALLEASGDDPDLAVECFQKSITYGYNIPEVHQKIGKLLLKKNNEAAIDCFETALRLNPNLKDVYKDLVYASLRFGKKEELLGKLAAAKLRAPHNEELEFYSKVVAGEKPDSKLYNKFVHDEFDSFAHVFDNMLVDKLGYNLPFEICGILKEVCGDEMHFNSVVDLGCGTGLSGNAIRSHAGYLAGIDISSKMIDISRNRNCYDSLHCGDIVKITGELRVKFDLFIATDVLVYIGELREFLATVKKCSDPGALLIFSVENYPGEGLTLQSSGRYAHSPEYIRGVTRELDCEVLYEKKVQLRKEFEEWVIGDVYVVRIA